MAIALNPFFELSLDLLCVADFDGYFKDVNPAFVKMIGYSKEELLSKKINTFIHEEDQRPTQKLREGIYENQSIINFENRYQTKSGEIVWLSWSAVPIENEKLVYGIAKDITHEKILKIQRIEELVKISKRNDELTSLSLIMAHDLRSPINNLISLFDFIAYDEIKNKETLKILNYLKIGVKGTKNSLENHLNLISQNLSVSSKLTEVVLADCLAKVIKTIRSLVENSNTKITSDFSAFESISFEKAYMESVFLNLITNAIKYSKPDVSPVINISTLIKAGKKVLQISDNGRGFDMTSVGNRIFGINERFTDSKDGKGVGLYLIHNQITSLGGTITVESQLNQGATFTIRFKS